MIIDIHTHVVPRAFPRHINWLRVESSSVDRKRVLRARGSDLLVGEEFYDARARMAVIETHAVDAEVVSPLPQLIDYEAPVRIFLEVCRYTNSYVAEFCASSPSTFAGLGMVPLQDPEVAASELGKIKSDGLAGVEIASSVTGLLVGNDRFVAFFQEAARLDLPILVHALPGGTHQLAGPAAAAFGMPAEIGLAAASVVSGRVPYECPGLRLAFSHGGGGFASALPRAQSFWTREKGESSTIGDERSSREPLWGSPIEIARRYYYDNLVFDAGAMRYLGDIFGAKQLVVGSDFPASPREPSSSFSLGGRTFTADEGRGIEWENAMRWLGVRNSQQLGSRLT